MTSLFFVPIRLCVPSGIQRIIPYNRSLAYDLTLKNDSGTIGTTNHRLQRDKPMAQHIVVTEYDPLWRKMFEEEAYVIKCILRDNCLVIHHIGSTSVQVLAAQPIIDIMPVVHSLERVDAVRKSFEEIGYEYLGEFGITGRRYLRKGGDERTHQIHIFSEERTDDIKRHLALRDYLRTHKEACSAYASLKKSLAEQYPYDIGGYCDGKDEYIKKIEKIALDWIKNTDSQPDIPSIAQCPAEDEYGRLQS